MHLKMWQDDKIEKEWDFKEVQKEQRKIKSMRRKAFSISKRKEMLEKTHPHLVDQFHLLPNPKKKLKA